MNMAYNTPQSNMLGDPFLLPGTQLNTIDGYGPLTNDQRFALAYQVQRLFPARVDFKIGSHEANIRLIYVLGTYYRNYGFNKQLYDICINQSEDYLSNGLNFLRGIFSKGNEISDWFRSCAKILYMRYVNGLSPMDIAVRLELNPHLLYQYELIFHARLSHYLQDVITREENSKRPYVIPRIAQQFTIVEITDSMVKNAKIRRNAEYEEALPLKPYPDELEIQLFMLQAELELMSVGIPMESAPSMPQENAKKHFKLISLDKVISSESLDDRKRAQKVVQKLMEESKEIWPGSTPVSADNQENSGPPQAIYHVTSPDVRHLLRNQALEEAISIAYSPDALFGTVKADSHIMTGLLSYYAIGSYCLEENNLSNEELKDKKTGVRKCLRNVLKKEDDMRYFLFLLFVMGKSAQEIASELGIAPGEVAQRQAIYLARLQAYWDAYESENVSKKVRDIYIWK